LLIVNPLGHISDRSACLNMQNWIICDSWDNFRTVSFETYILYLLYVNLEGK